MSEFDRAMKLGRAYANKAHDALFGSTSPEEKAMKELNEALEQGAILQKSEQQQATQQIAAMSEEEAEIILGVPTNAPYSQLKSQYELLLTHVKEFDAKFPDKKQISARERQRIEKAFQMLSAKADPTEKRFGSLEID